MNETIEHRLWNQYIQIEYLIKDLHDGFLQKRHNPEKWSIHENLAHLGRYHEIFIDRIDTILKQKEPFFERYKVEEDPLFKKWLELDTSEIIKNTKKK